MSWTKDKVFNSGDDFVKWLDDNYSKYITSGISELHMHHTYKPNHSSVGSTLSLHQGIRNFHVNANGWSDIGEHITIGKDGKIVLGRPITIMPASATSYNGSTASHPFMFETIGNFDKGHDVLEGSQLSSVLAVCKYFHIAKSKKLKFHNEMSGKTCPGSGIDKVEFVKLVEGGSTYTPPKPQTKPATVDKPSWTEVTGSWTGQTLKQGQYGDPVKQLQTKLSKNDPPFYPNKGAKNNGIDSYYGDDTKDAVRRYQSYYGLDVDGMAGKATYAKLGGKTVSHVKVDGFMGKATITALQKYFGTTVDGKLSKPSLVIKKLQGLLKVNADGLMGPNTIKVMQRRFGTPIDGKLSKPSVVIKELQKRLNKGKL